MKMKLAVCDDNRLFLEELKRQLEEIPMVEKADTFSDLASFWEAVGPGGGGYDAVLMDIDWKTGDTGMDVAEELYRKCPGMKIIYVTGYNDRFSQQIFLHPANLSGYLTKPVDRALLEANLRKIRQLRGGGEPSLVLYPHGQALVLPFRDIVYIDSSRHNVTVYTESDAVTVYGKLSSVSEQLSGDFFQCHKSYVVNLRQIRRIAADGILLKGGRSVPVSRSRYGEMKEAWFRFAEAAFAEE